jgi:hypothetical protein
VGFNILKEIKKRLDQKYDNLIWMKLSEIARYWAARQLTSLTAEKGKIIIKAPYSCSGFTLKVSSGIKNAKIKSGTGDPVPLTRVKSSRELVSNTFFPDKAGSLICFNLGKGTSEILL